MFKEFQRIIDDSQQLWRNNVIGYPIGPYSLRETNKHFLSFRDELLSKHIFDPIDSQPRKALLSRSLHKIKDPEIRKQLFTSPLLNIQINPEHSTIFHNDNIFKEDAFLLLFNSQVYPSYYRLLTSNQSFTMDDIFSQPSQYKDHEIFKNIVICLQQTMGFRPIDSFIYDFDIWPKFFKDGYSISCKNILNSMKIPAEDFKHSTIFFEDPQIIRLVLIHTHYDNYNIEKRHHDDINRSIQKSKLVSSIQTSSRTENSIYTL